MQQSFKPNQRRRLPLELLYEITKFVPLNGLIECGQSNSAMGALGIPRARKVQQKLISLYFEDISTLAIWFRQWALEIAEARAQIRRKAFKRLKSLVRTWWNLSNAEKAKADVRYWHARTLMQLNEDLNEFYQLLVQYAHQSNRIFAADQTDHLARFNFSPQFQRKLRQIRAAHIQLAFAPAEVQLVQWRRENIPNWYEMITRFGALLRSNFHEELNFCVQGFYTLTRHAQICENMIKMAAEHLNRGRGD